MILISNKSKSQGMSLIEILVAITVGGVMITGAALLMNTSLQSSKANKELTMASSLLLETQEAIKDVVASNWHNIDGLTKGEPNHYKIVKSGDIWTAQSGEETIVSGNITFTRYFVVDNVSRTNSSIDMTYNASYDDPSTQKITAYIKWGVGQKTLSLAKYITRFQNTRTFVQSDWSGGSGENGILIQPNDRYDTGTNVQSLNQ